MRLFEWDRDFAVFFCTQGISNIGDAAWGVLIPLYVLQLTRNPLQWLGLALRLAHGPVTFAVLGAALLVLAVGVALVPAPRLPAAAEV